MGVMRLGYVHARVTDLEEARAHYTGTLGMRTVDEVPGKIWLKSWDEWDHHSVVLEEGGVGLVKLGYKVRTEEDLATYEKNLTTFGVTVERMSKGDNLGVGDGVRFTTPSEHVIELYQDIEYIGGDVGLINPELFPRDLVGIGVPFTDHCLITAEDPALNERLFIEALDFKPAERLVTDLSDDAELVGTWMFCQHKTHDLAFIKGPNGKLHHWAYKLGDWDAIRHAGIQLSMDDVPISFGPEIHGLSRGATIYFYDPAGNRNEVFAGGYETYPDFPTMTWTADNLPRAAAYITRELPEKHFEILT
jgi:catechol 2,3-dioxygenase